MHSSKECQHQGFTRTRSMSITIVVLLILLTSLTSCSSTRSEPQLTQEPVPTTTSTQKPAPTATSTQEPAPTATPTQEPTPIPIPLTDIDLNRALLQPADLTLGDTKPAEGWLKCDRTYFRNTLAQKSSQIKVEKADAVSWVFGAGCEAGTSALTVDEYVWIAENERYASRLAEDLKGDSGLQLFQPMTIHPLKRSDFGPTTLTTLEIQLMRELEGFTGAEVVTQFGEAVVFLSITTREDLIDQDYLDLGELSVKRLQRAQMGLY
jgi:hypothetical protein